MIYFRFVLITSIYLVVLLPGKSLGRCGCKVLSECYQTILKEVLKLDEVLCIEDAAGGTATYGVFLKLLHTFCSETVYVNVFSKTYEKKNLYEVVINEGSEISENQPVILIDAGQAAGAASVELALYIIQQLVACEENKHMLEKVKWVVLPSVNPDGLERNRQYRSYWKKNTQLAEDTGARGVDITRNFGEEWDNCGLAVNPNSPNYPGRKLFSEQESLFVKNVIGKYKNQLKAYLSIRRDGHSILYPYAYSDKDGPNLERTVAVAGNISRKVNQKAGLLQTFLNDSIFNQNGGPRCGHSVDFASRLEVPFALEMKVFLVGGFLTKFHRLPKGYDASLRAGYFEGVKQLFEEVLRLNEK